MASRAAVPPSPINAWRPPAKGSEPEFFRTVSSLVNKRHVVFPRAIPAEGPNEVTTCARVSPLRHSEDVLMNPAARPHAGSSSASGPESEPD